MIGHKPLLFSLGLAFLPLAFTACGSEDSYEEATLTITENTLVFDKNGSEKLIAINTNQSKWIASSPQEGEWLQLTQEGNALRIKTSPNLQGKERVAYIVVNANGATEKIEIRQNAADVLLTLSQNEVNIPQTGGTKVVDITNNVGSYELTSEEQVDWLNIEQDTEEIKLTATPNNTTTTRSVKLFIKTGGQTREVAVVQSGIQNYILPINPGASFDVHKFMDFEAARGSYLRAYRAANPTFGVEERYTFITPSPIFTLIEYSSADGATTSQIVTVGDGKKAIEAVKDRAFERFLLENGYQRIGGASSQEYLSTRDQLSLKVYISERLGNEGVNLTFKPTEIQPQDYATFAALPSVPTELIQKKNKKLSDIEAYEASKGSTENRRRMHEQFPTEVANIQYRITADNAPIIGRGYYFYNSDSKNKIASSLIGSVESCVLLAENVNLGLWNSGSNWYVTTAMKNLLAHEGFTHLNSGRRIHYYTRSTDKMNIALTPIEEDGKTMLALLYSYDESTLTTLAKQLQSAKR